MAVSDFIAAGALLVAGASFALQRFDHRRDQLQRARERAEDQRRWEVEVEAQRPQLAIDWNWNLGDSGIWIGINVTAKPGRPSTSVVEVGFALEDELELARLPEVPYPPAEPAQARGHASFPILEELHPCEPGQRYTFRIEPQELPVLMDAETPLVPYALDVEGTRHEGPAMAIFQRLYDEGWRPPPNALPTFPNMKVVYTEPASHAGQSATFSMVEPPEDS